MTARDSMSLLTDLAEESLHSDYEPRPGAPATQRSSWGPVGFAVLVAAGLVLGVSAVWTRDTAPSTESQRADLAARVEQAAADDEALDLRVAGLRTDLAQAESDALSASARGRQLAERTAALEAQAGYTPLSGAGAVVVLRDAEDAASGGADDLGRVIDRDVQLAVNGLWAAGARGIAVNGQRLSARTAIRGAGGAILVDYRPLRPPYRIEAVGEPGALLTGVRSGPVGEALRALSDAYGLRWSAEPAEALTLPPAGSMLPRLATAEPVGPDGTAP